MKMDKLAIQQMIMEELVALDERFTSDQWSAIYGKNKPIGTVDSDKLTKFAQTNMSSMDVFDKLKDAGQNPTVLDVTDIEYYINNPDKIDPEVQSRLIAVSRSGGGGDKKRFEKIVKNVQSMGIQLAADINNRPDNANNADVQFPNPIPDGVNATAKRQRVPYEKAVVKFRLLSDPKTANEMFTLATKAEEALAALDAGLASAAASVKTASEPLIRTQAGETGSFPEGQMAVVNRLFSGLNTIQDRLAELTSISKKYYEASQAAADMNEDSDPNSALAQLKKEFAASPSKVLNEILVLDVFNTLVKDTDAGSGAYTFEYFLALVTGGTVAGKMKTAAGKMGAADFVMTDDKGNPIELGSAKFFKDDTGHNIKQAVSGFKDIYDGKNPVKIRYSIGLKKQGLTQIGKPLLGSSDPNKIIAVEVFTPEVSFDGNKFYIDGKEATEKGGSVLIPTDGLTPVGVMYICRTRTETFRQMLDDAMVNISDDAEELFELFKVYFDSLRNANQSAKVYIANGNVDDGNKVYKNLFTAEDNFSKMSQRISVHKHSARTVDRNRRMLDPTSNKIQRGLRENKKNEINSLKALDKLIEQVILYKNTEEK